MMEDQTCQYTEPHSADTGIQHQSSSPEGDLDGNEEIDHDTPDTSIYPLYAYNE